LLKTKVFFVGIGSVNSSGQPHILKRVWGETLCTTCMRWCRHDLDPVENESFWGSHY